MRRGVLKMRFEDRSCMKASMLMELMRRKERETGSGRGVDNILRRVKFGVMIGCSITREKDIRR